MDTKLRLKPIELLDIGIDKLTKIPIPILNNNIVSEFDMDNGIPTDSFILNFNANYSDKKLSATISSSYEFVLNFDYGDGITEGWLISTGGTSIFHEYSSVMTYEIIATGWIEKIKSLIILPYSGTGGITSASLNLIKKLSYLDLSNNRLTSLDLDGMISLNSIILEDNYLPNDVIDDLYIQTDTFLTVNGNISTVGTYNGKPSIYSDFDRKSLIEKGWTLNYNL